MEPFLGELRIFSFGVIPRGWAACDGTLIPVQQNQALFSILGVAYGGDGKTNFALPDLRGRVPMHANGTSYIQGKAGGANASTLTLANMPAHNHQVMVAPVAATQPAAGSNILATTTDNEYAARGNNALVAMATPAIGMTGSNLPVTNMQPYLGLSICIATQGLYPTRS